MTYYNQNFTKKPIAMHAKLILLLHLSFFFLVSAFGQTKTNVSFTNSDRSALQIEMEQSISGLLTELNNASASNRYPRLQNLKITEECASRIGELWANASISIPERTIIDSLLLTSEFSAFGKGYQVRNIPLSLKGKDGNVGKEMGVITLNSFGQIVAFYFTAVEQKIDPENFKDKNIVEYDRRMRILEVVEQFKTAYYMKDIQTIDDFFSDFELNIVGQEVKREANSDLDRFTVDKVIYKTQDKQQYLELIKKMFSRNEFIEVKFNDIKISKHKGYPDIYGVNLVQTLNSPSYQDVGNLFLIIDFKDEKKIKILVCAWQPLGPEKLDLSDFTFFKL
jgi:hypothetical protein